MIPLQDQERLKQYFTEQLTGGVKVEHFTQRPLSIVVPGREACLYCKETRQLLDDLRALSPKIILRVHELDDARALAASLGVERAPSTVWRGQLNRPVRFEGFFGNLLFAAMVRTIIEISRGATSLEPQIKRRLQRIRDKAQIRVFLSLTNPYAPEMMQTAFAFGLENHRLAVTVTEVEEFPRLVETLGIRALPFTMIGNRVRFAGAVGPDMLLEQIVRAGEQRAPSPQSMLRVGAPVPSLGPTIPLQTQSTAEPRATPSGLIIPGR